MLYEAQRILENILPIQFAMRTSTSTASTINAQITDTTSVSFITPCEQEITAHASWNNTAQPHTQSLTYISTDSTEYKNVGNDCGGLQNIPSSGTALPTLISASYISTNTELTSGDMFNGFLYSGSASSTSVQTQSTNLYAFDMHNPQKIIETSSINGSGFRSIDAAGNMIYAATNSTSSQLTVLDDSNPSNPHVVTTATLPGVSPIGSYPGGTSIYYYNSRVYVGTHRTAGNEFHIFDVTNPDSPTWLGSLELNHNINAIFVRDNVAYLGTSGNTKDIIVLDVSKPAGITQLSSVAFVGNEDTLSINLLGPYLYVGRAKETAPGQAEFNILDISNPSQPILTGSLALNDSVMAIAVSNNRAYLGLSNNKLAVVDVSSSTNPILVSTLMLPDSPRAIDFEVNGMSIILKKGIIFASL